MSQPQTLQVISPSNPVEVLTLIDVKSCEQFARDCAALVKEGYVDPMKVRVLMYVWEKAFKEIKTAIEPEVESEAAKHGKQFEFMGAKCEWGPTYTAYDYEAANDPEWANAKLLEERHAFARKQREEFLRSLKAPLTVVDNNTGEIVTINPPHKKQTEGLKITIK